MINNFCMTLGRKFAGLIQGFGIQLVPETIQDLTWKQLCFTRGFFSQQQTILLGQRKAGTIRGLSVQFKQFCRCAAGCHNTGIADFKSN